MSRPEILAAPTESYSAGDSLENPVTGELGTLIKGPLEGDDSSLEVELRVQPGGAVAGEHIHPSLDERFTVKAGRIGFRLDGRESVAGPGESVEIPRGSWHDWWNASDEEEAVAQVYVSDGLRFMLMIENLFGLARDGHTNEKGLPDPLQLTMFATEFRDVLIFKRPPAAVQKVLFGVLRPIASARGYRGAYPQYSRSLLGSSAR
ncbi:MAG TPA: cupin domain-containing protein [Solirubrobacterales bacterium]|nr:cupin domain-containing protein [Solirubrobacterales bacterium]